MLGGPADGEAGEAWRDAAVDDGGDALRLRDGIEVERVLGREGDVGDGPARLEGGPHGLRPHEPGDGSDDDVDLRGDTGNLRRVGEVGSLGLQVRNSREAPEGVLAAVDGKDGPAAIGSEVPGDE